MSEAAEMDARTVLQAMHYEAFLSDFERTYYELNKPEPGK